MGKNTDNLDASAPCKPAARFSFAWQQPVDKQGKPYLRGYRICKNADCVQEQHITQSRFIAKRVYGYVPNLYRLWKVPPVTIEQLREIARPVDRYIRIEKCQVPECNEPHQALHLCSPQHNQLYRWRMSKGLKERQKRDNSDIEQYMLPPLGNDLKAKDRYCHYPECKMPYFARGLCKVHHKRWLRWKERQND